MRGGGYVVDALEAALWALRTTSSFEDGVLAAVNLGDDADTTAAIYGQLAGAHYGLDGIPERWRERVHQRDEILAFADALFDLDRSRPALVALRPHPAERDRLLRLARRRARGARPWRRVRGPQRRPRLRRALERRPAC